jgi:hypothetical protein
MSERKPRATRTQAPLLFLNEKKQRRDQKVAAYVNFLNCMHENDVLGKARSYGEWLEVVDEQRAYGNDPYGYFGGGVAGSLADW